MASWHYVRTSRESLIFHRRREKSPDDVSDIEPSRLCLCGYAYFVDSPVSAWLDRGNKSFRWVTRLINGHMDRGNKSFRGGKTFGAIKAFRLSPINGSNQPPIVNHRDVLLLHWRPDGIDEGKVLLPAHSIRSLPRGGLAKRSISPTQCIGAINAFVG